METIREELCFLLVKFKMFGVCEKKTWLVQLKNLQREELLLGND
jgi:hypothetical protein